MNAKRKEKTGFTGFTLLELLMVVIIIAILAAVAIPGYGRVAERARASEAIQLMATIRGAELRYKVSNTANNYTTLLTDLDVDFAFPAGSGITDFWTLTVLGTGAGSNARALRNVGAPFAGNIELDLDSGNVCSNNGVWGQIVGAC